MNLSIIAARSRNNVIGADNSLPWVLPTDMKRFRDLTRGKVVIMGRRTFESIGKPLPERTNIVVTKTASFADKFTFGTPTLLSVTSLLPALQLASQLAAGNARLTGDPSKDEIVVIGGSSLYRDCLPIANKLYLTTIHVTCPGDTMFPEFDQNLWSSVQTEEITDPGSYLKSATEKTPLTYTYESFTKVS